MCLKTKRIHLLLFQSDQEDKVYTRDFSEPTLDDHFDKTVLPKVMQVILIAEPLYYEARICDIQ